MNISAAERFWSKVDFDGPMLSPYLGPCWLWTAYTYLGYGMFHVNGRGPIRSHRWAYESWHGPVPAPLVLDHLCRVRNCVNPAHLEPVTNRENGLRGVGFVAREARKTHCPQGHEYTPDNTKLESGKRKCRTCALAQGRIYKARARLRT